MNRPTLTRREIDAACAHVSTDPARYNLIACQVSHTNGWTRIEATDGRTLLRVQHPEQCEDFEVRLQPGPLKAAASIIKNGAANPNKDTLIAYRVLALDIPENDERVMMHVLPPDAKEDAVPIATALVDQLPSETTFPLVDNVIPRLDREDEYVRVTVSPDFIARAAKAIASNCSTDTVNVVQLHIKKEKSHEYPVVMTAEHPNNGTRACAIIMPINAAEPGVTGDPRPPKFPPDPEPATTPKA